MWRSKDGLIFVKRRIHLAPDIPRVNHKLRNKGDVLRSRHKIKQAEYFSDRKKERDEEEKKEEGKSARKERKYLRNMEKT